MTVDSRPEQRGVVGRRAEHPRQRARKLLLGGAVGRPGRQPRSA